MGETELQKAIVSALTQNRVWVIRTQVSGRRGSRSVATGEPGMPDLYLPGLGHLEIKHGTGKLSDVQVEWHERARKAGVKVETVRSVSEAISVVARWRAEG